MKLFSAPIISVALLFHSAEASESAESRVASVELGQFSASMGVKDIQKSFGFYKKLGFERIVGDIAQKWLILKNRSNGTFIGLFEDGREGISLTFNPLDVRAVQQQLKNQGIVFESEVAGGSGPGFATVKDPDGHLILLDQH
jgi:catechol 2,3-dioxygenase-like lactoylglutathione lyase family enzyme